MTRPELPARAPLPPRDPRQDTSQNHYWHYHALENLLACKQPITASEDEDLFIAVHQMCELAFHQMILDLERALHWLGRVGAEEDRAGLAEPGPAPLDEAAYFLRRVVKMYEVVNRTIPILMTMRGFSEFRSSIGPSSGFQSLQFRRLEIMSGVQASYWTGGTADHEGRLHPAETEFERRFGSDVETCFAAFRHQNLRAQFERLCARTGQDARAEQIARVAALPGGRRLLELLRDYEQVQLAFHRIHRQLAIQQLELVGVTYGTGGTSFRDYLQRYERDAAPLFGGLAEWLNQFPAARS